jgi:cell division protein FtsW
VLEIQEAMASGGLFGVGYSRSDLKDRIPESTTDGIIGVIGAEGGFFLVSLVIVLYLIIFLRGMKIASEAEDAGGKALAVGISVWIILQSFWNIAGMVGLFPLKGLPLPFISEGGTAMVINLMTIGILLNISTQKNPEVLTQQKLETKTKQKTVSHAR